LISNSSETGCSRCCSCSSCSNHVTVRRCLHQRASLVRVCCFSLQS
jgi:hypothetical protein